jgi:uncharacterized membrane protein
VRGRRPAAGAALAAWGTASALAGPDFLRRSGQSLLRALPHGTAELKRAVTVNRPRAALYAFWHDFANLARLMPDVPEIRPDGERRWHWTVRGPGGVTAEGEVERVEERADEFIAWRSLGDGGTVQEGTVRFQPAPGGRGSEVHVTISSRAPAGRAGRTVASLFGAAPGRPLRDLLRRFKQLMETNEIPVPAPPPANGHERGETTP